MVEVTSGMHLQGQIIAGGRGSRIGAGLQEEESEGCRQAALGFAGPEAEQASPSIEGNKQVGNLS